MSLSHTEQDLACNAGQVAAFEAVMNHLNDESVSDMDRLRLIMLYALSDCEYLYAFDALSNQIDCKPF